MTTINRRKLVKGKKLQAPTLNTFFNDIVTQINEPLLNTDNIKYRSNFDLKFNTRIFRNKVDKRCNPAFINTIQDPDRPTGTTKEIVLSGDLGSPTLNEDTKELSNLYQHFHFILPNTQKYFNKEGLTQDSYVYSLDRLIISVDTLDNPAATIIHTDGIQHSIEDTGDMDITVILHRKTPYINSQKEFWEEKVSSWTLPGSAFLNAGLNTNPFIFDNLKLKIFPDSIYLISITTNIGDTYRALYKDLNHDRRNFIINNLQIDLQMSCPLIEGFPEMVDVTFEGVTQPYLNVQNAPWYGVKDLVLGGGNPINNPLVPSDVISSIPIVAGDEITEALVQGNMVNIDQQVSRKLVGGYLQDSSLANPRQIKTDFCYESKQIPLFNNNNILYGWRKIADGDPEVPPIYKPQATIQGFTGTGANLMAYNAAPLSLGAGVFELPNPVVWGSYVGQQNIYQVADRKFIPIHEPFIIDNIIMTYWVGHPTDYAAAMLPESEDTYFELEVFMHTLNRSDKAARKRIAYAKWQPIEGVDKNTLHNILIDKSFYLEQQNSLMAKTGSLALQPCGFTVQIPTNYTDTFPVHGTGYTKTGQPFYLGKGNHPYSGGKVGGSSLDFRWPIISDINSDMLEFAPTEGLEQYLEIIMKIGNPNGIGTNMFTYNFNPQPELEPNYIVNWAEQGIKLQQPGAMLYLNGSKSLINTRANE